ncbi:MAG: hypothetical protein FWC77_06320, partial [Defluviitaleaceae bacterium]|nr:hypothetical protein [Defluviitaleaceae bacterium]
VDIHFENLKDTQPDNALAGYAFFYKIYDECIQSGLPREESFNKARSECIANGYLKGFIDKEAFVMFYKDILDYDTQLKEEGKTAGKIEGAEQTISVAIRNKAPIALIEAMAKEANVPQERLNELLKQIAV